MEVAATREVQGHKEGPCKCPAARAESLEEPVFLEKVRHVLFPASIKLLKTVFEKDLVVPRKRC